MKHTKFFAIVAATAIAVGAFTVVTVRAVEPGHRPMGGQILKRMISELELTEDQIVKIKTELRAEKENIVPLLKQLHQSRKGLRETIQSSGEESAVRAAHAKVAAVEADLAVQRAKLHARIAPLLTDAQILKVKAFEEKVDNFVIQAIKTVGERLE